MTNVRMVPQEVEAFIAGQLNESQQAQLAQQVAEIVAASPLVPNEATTYLERVVRHLGGQAQLLDWLAHFPGEPALVAATQQLIDLLGALSYRDLVVDALRDVRRTTPDPAPLRAYLPPDTDHVTLSDLAEALSMLLRGRDVAATLSVGFASLDLLDASLARAGAQGADITMAASTVSDVRSGLDRAASSLYPDQREPE